MLTTGWPPSAFLALMPVPSFSTDRLKALMNDEAGSTDCRALIETLRQNRKALQTVLDQRAKFDHAEGGRPGREVIDLGEARAEIARRLARLRK